MPAVAPVGSMLLGKYRVERVLGEGGMGVVVAARHIELDDVLAIKILSEDEANSQEMFQRFVREAKTTARLRSEHVVRVSDVGRLPNGTPYMVMELLVGRDLMRVIRDDGRQSAKFAALIGMQVCEALAEAHGLGIVHRDLKAANLFVTSAPNGSAHAKVLDFGIAKAPVATAEGVLTLESTILGTPSYMAPEQLRSTRTVDGRADIWSLGVVLYELIEGRRPFGYPGVRYPDLLVAIETKDPPPMKYASAELAAVIMRCLEKTPARRTPSMLELARELGPFLSDHRAAEMAIEKIKQLVNVSGLAASAKAISPSHTPAAPPGRFAATASMSSEAADGEVAERTRITAMSHIDEDGNYVDADDEAVTKFAARKSSGPQVQLGLEPLRIPTPAPGTHKVNSTPAPNRAPTGEASPLIISTPVPSSGAGLVASGVVISTPSQPTMMTDMPVAPLSPSALADLPVVPLSPNVLVTPSLGAYSLPSPPPRGPLLPPPSSGPGHVVPHSGPGQMVPPPHHAPSELPSASSGPSWTVLALGAALAGAAGAIVYTLLS